MTGTATLTFTGYVPDPDNPVVSATATLDSDAAQAPGATSEFSVSANDTVVTTTADAGEGAGAELRSFFGYDPSARYGMFVAADLDGDGVTEIVSYHLALKVFLQHQRLAGNIVGN